MSKDITPSKHAHLWLQGCWWLLLMALFVVTLWFSWHLLARINYGYSWFYDTVGVSQNVIEFGPQNQYRKGFEKTTRQEHYRLFHEIVVAINERGTGLATISYRSSNGDRIDTLLHAAEVTHLRDVARLVAHFDFAGVLSVLMAMVLAGIIYWQRIERPKGRSLVIATIGLCLLVAVLILVVGPIDVFYTLHDWVFPAGHQWFFYYQESLMTTLMKAPDIFGYISALWAVVTLVLFTIICKLLWYWRP